VNFWLRFVRFYVVGGMGTTVQLATLAILVHVVSLDYRVAAVMALLVALAHNFAWHVRWTWHDRPPAGGIIPGFGRFVSANGLVSLAGTVALMPALVSAAGVPPVPANLIVIGTCGCVNFWLGGRACFPQKSTDRGQGSVLANGVSPG